MGIDVCLYRARIGTFLACHKLDGKCIAHPVGASRLILALSPKPCTLLAFMCISSLLICAGDVETNPGPKIEDVLALLRDFMSEANKQHANTTAVLEEMKQGINDIKTRVAVIETNLASVLQIEKGVTTVGGSVEEVKVSISRANEELVNAVDDLNNRMRRNNLIIKGLSEEEKEDYTSTERIVREFFATKLETTLEPNDIERAHRVGQPRPDFTRPIIVKFLNFKTKSDALRNGPKLKDLEPKVWLEEDFSQKVQLERKKLRDFAKSNRANNERYYIRFNKLQLHGITYRYDATSGRVVQLASQNSGPSN